MLSLYNQIQSENHQFYQGIEDLTTWQRLSENHKADILEILQRRFVDEKTEVWAAAALALGHLAAFEARAENILQYYALAITNIHNLRHVFTALGSYSAALEEDREFVLLTQYKKPIEQVGKNCGHDELHLKVVPAGVSPTTLRNDLVNALKSDTRGKEVPRLLTRLLTGSKKTNVTFMVAPVREAILGILREMTAPVAKYYYEEEVATITDETLNDLLARSLIIKEWLQAADPIQQISLQIADRKKKWSLVQIARVSKTIS